MPRKVGWIGNGNWLEGNANPLLPLFLVPVRVSGIADNGANSKSTLPPTYSIPKSLVSSTESGCLPLSYLATFRKCRERAIFVISTLASSTFRMPTPVTRIIAVPILAVCVAVSTPAASTWGRRLG